MYDCIMAYLWLVIIEMHLQLVSNVRAIRGMNQ